MRGCNCYEKIEVHRATDRVCSQAGLVINYLFSTFDDDKVVSDNWTSQLKNIVPLSSRPFTHLDSITGSETKLLTLNDLEECKTDLTYNRF